MAILNHIPERRQIAQEPVVQGRLEARKPHGTNLARVIIGVNHR